ncbi:tripartite tricarboxylate transporter substrate binding protein [Faunimonas sp. B44]|uniref:tripartite tricarboxylate transporter substrate binding protein n=1 Tax=Faunimonas sp. B44 TaxID=3461493 RepID=UPI004044EF92
MDRNSPANGRKGASLKALAVTGLLVAFGAATAGGAAAQGKAPTGEIEITVGSGAGAGPDLTQRRVAKILNDEKIVTNPIVVQNRTGGSWTVASNYVIGQKGNENLLFGISPTVFASPIVQGLDPWYKQLTPLATLIAADLLFTVRTDSPINSLTDLVEQAKKEEFSISVGGANIGSTDHIVTTLLEKAADIKINFIPFDGGGGQITSAVISGAVTMGVYPPDEALPLIKGGQMKAIAILSEDRHPSDEFKDVPTAREQGFDVVWSSPQSLTLPPDADPELIAWWDDKLQKMVATDAWKNMLAENYFRDIYAPASEAGAEMDKLHERYLNILTELGLAKQKS